MAFNFDQLADRKSDNSKKWDREFNEGYFGKLPDEYISMWIADLDYEVTPIIHKKIEEIVDKKTYGYIYFYDELFEAIKQWQGNKSDFSLNNEMISLNFGIVSALYVTVQAFCREGDSIIINSPVYNPFRVVAEVNHIGVLENELEVDQEYRYQINFQNLEELIVEHQPKIYILCNPHNPGGRVWSKEELQKIADLCLENNVILVSDEAHADHINQVQFTSALSLDKKYTDNLIVLNSANKGFNFAGLKMGYNIIPNPDINNLFKQQLKKQGILEPNIFGAAALCASYTNEGKEWLEASYDYMVENYDWASSYLSQEVPELKITPLDSTYLMWLDVSSLGMNGDEVVERLAQEEGILFQPGSSFGQAGINHIRINLGTSKEVVQKSFQKFADWCQKNKR